VERLSSRILLNPNNMHFTVMVIGENAEQQLAPFQENNMGDCPKEFLEFQEDDDYDVDVETGKKGHWYNPNAKWDWYSLGGRWSGSIKLKEGASGVVGQSGTFGNEVGIDSAKAGDIENLESLPSFAILKDGVWIDQDQMDDTKWKDQRNSILSSLSDDTLISIYDCHM
jgi:hypothetical protein